MSISIITRLSLSATVFLMRADGWREEVCVERERGGGEGEIHLAKPQVHGTLLGMKSASPRDQGEAKTLLRQVQLS